jgi:hypothetical protein
MEQDHARRGGVAPFDIMKAHTVAPDEDADRRVLSLRCHLNAMLPRIRTISPAKTISSTVSVVDIGSILRWSALAGTSNRRDNRALMASFLLRASRIGHSGCSDRLSPKAASRTVIRCGYRMGGEVSSQAETFPKSKFKHLVDWTT